MYPCYDVERLRFERVPPSQDGYLFWVVAVVGSVWSRSSIESIKTDSSRDWSNASRIAAL